MTRNYSQFYTYITQWLLSNGASLVKDVPSRYRQFTHNGFEVFLPYYHKYAFVVFYGDKVYFNRSRRAAQANEDFEVFLKCKVNAG